MRTYSEQPTKPGAYWWWPLGVMTAPPTLVQLDESMGFPHGGRWSDILIPASEAWHDPVITAALDSLKEMNQIMTPFLEGDLNPPLFTSPCLVDLRKAIAALEERRR